MLVNYLKVILRIFLTEPLYMLINIFGLSVGIATCIMIAQYVQFELSFDRYAKQPNSIYRMYMRLKGPEVEVDNLGPPSVGPYLKENLPNITSAARIIPVDLEWSREYLLRKVQAEGDLAFSKEHDFYYVDQDILRIFAIQMIEGSAGNCLVEPNSIIITKKIADRLFPKESAVNKTLQLKTIKGLKDYLVTGVTANPPANSSLQYSALLSIKDADDVFLKLVGRKADDVWGYAGYCVSYIEVMPEADIPQLTKKINTLLRDRFPKLKSLSIESSFGLVPFNSSHFYRPYGYVTSSTIDFSGDKRVVSFFIILAVIVVIITWINYINLTTARALKRAKEVGMRKVSGANRKNIVLQFLLESFMLNLISILLAMTIVQAFFTKFISMMGSDAQLIFLERPTFWITIIIFLLFSTLASGMYPALVLSRYSPSKVLKGKFERSTSGSRLRKGLVLIQFGFASLLLLCIYVVLRQLLYMQNKDVGLNSEQVIVINTKEMAEADRRSAFRKWKQKIVSIPDILGVAACIHPPGDFGLSAVGFYRTSEDLEDHHFFWPNLISVEYLNTMEMTLLSGREFRDQSREKYNVILNETAARSLGFNEPANAVGTSIRLTNETTIEISDYEIIGIVKDVNVRVNWGPVEEIFFFDTASFPSDPRAQVVFDNFIVKLSGNDMQESILKLKKVWLQLFRDVPFDYYFLDSYFYTFYKQERQFANVFGFFSLIAVIICCLGLFGLSSYNVTSRTKEIGIRKSFGATVVSLVWLFSKDYLRLVFVAATIGIPVGLVLLQDWLENYPDHLNLKADVVLIPLVLIAIIATFTIGVQTYRTAQADPVEALRSE